MIGEGHGAVLSHGRNRTKAVVRRIDRPDGPAVLKDYSGRPLWVRRVVGPLLLDWEEAALRQLDGLDGVPRVLARPGRDRLLMSWIEGTPLRGAGRGVPEAFFSALEDLLDAMHARGVAQADIGSGDVLVRPDGTPALVDFAVAVRRGKLVPLWKSFASAVRHDRHRLGRLRGRFGASP